MAIAARAEATNNALGRAILFVGLRFIAFS
jgi:hypothetical protein